MAFWLDPQNHPVPIELQNGAIIGRSNFKESDPLEIPSPLPATFRLPEGVERIVAVDPQGGLLVFGTTKGVDALRQTVAFLDKPQRQLQPELTLFWIDSLAPDAQKWSASTNPLFMRVASADDLNALEALVRADRALRVNSPALRISSTFTFFPSPPATFSSPPPAAPKLTIPNVARGRKFESPMPLWKPDPQIDPGIQMLRATRPVAPLPEVPRAPLLFGSGQNAFHIFNPDAPRQAIIVSLQEGKPILVSGAALGLKPPTPRFGIAVLLVTPRLVTAPVGPIETPTP